jgi:1,4-dihydroxy-2-naphthoate octaprenyltransferase
MNTKGQIVGFALIIVAFLLVLVAFALIPIFKNTLDDVRDTPSLNCRGTSTFNETAFEADSTNSSVLARLARRPTCFVTGISMVWFILAFLFAVAVWLVNNWAKKRRRVR